MTPAEPPVGPRLPPSELDEMVDLLEHISSALVLLDERPLSEVHAAIRDFGLAVQEHVRTLEPFASPPGPPSSALSEARAILRSDHAWFLGSLEQLEWFYRIVEGEDHGGHRQALGQYGRVLAEALRRHRRDERAYFAAVAEPLARVPP